MPDHRNRIRRTALAACVGLVAVSSAVLAPGPAGADELDPDAPPAADTLAADGPSDGSGAGTASVAEAQSLPALSVTGFGFGHGRGLGQYGALGYAIEPGLGWGRDQILDHFYGGTTAAVVNSGMMDVRLMAQDGQPTTVAVGGGNGISISVDSAPLDGGWSGGTWVYTGAPAVRLVLSGSTWTFEALSGCGGVSYGPPVAVQSTNVIRVRPALHPNGELLPVDDPALPLDQTLQLCTGGTASTSYRGELQAWNDNGTQRTVNELPTELYLRGVVPRESPASWSELGTGPACPAAAWSGLPATRSGCAALEAQAVAARTYALSENRWSFAKTCDTTSCQVYGGRATTANGLREDARTNAAIDATVGLVRVRNGQVVRAEFSSSTGGMTAGGQFPVVVDAGDATSRNPNRTWTTPLTVAAIEQRYARTGLQSVAVTERTGVGAEGGRVLKVRLVFADGTVVERTGNQFRTDFGLRSDWFTVSWAAPPPAPVGSPVMTGYSASEWVDYTAAATWMQVSNEEFQRVGAWVTAFLIGISRNPNEVGWLSPAPETEGPMKVTTVYLDEDLPAIRAVMRRWTLTPSQAQKVSATVLTFLAGIDRARRGG